ncbi:MAG TPA: DUF3147 family protein [Steroidobacteraceae bacterium]
MSSDLVIRFVVGGGVVAAFAALGDVLRPKSFAGLFGAAPSVALATLGLTITSKGSSYAALEARSMMIGALAFVVYAHICARLLLRRTYHSALVTIAGLVPWLLLALGGWWLLRAIR